MAIKLTTTQQQIAQQIIDYGAQNNFTADEIAIAVKTAFIESSLGDNVSTPPPTPDNPNPTASGLFQYTDSSWRIYHSDLGDKNDINNQIKAFYNDLATYKNWYNDPVFNKNIPKDQIDLGEYVYIKHHDGRSFKDFLNAPGLIYWNRTPFTPEVKIPSNISCRPSDAINSLYLSGRNWAPSGSPLVIDLDGDGIETVGIQGASL